MVAEVSALVGAGRGERAPEERLTHRNGLPAAAVANARRRARAADPEDSPRSDCPSFLERRDGAPSRRS
jgi:hypothetical protein